MGKTSVYIERLEVNGFKSFAGNHVFNLAHADKKSPGLCKLPQCTVFLGDNGTGKTNLLKILANLQPERVEIKDVKSEMSVHGQSDIQDLHFVLKPVIEGAAAEEPRWHNCYRPKVVERYNGEEYSVYTQFVAYHGKVDRIGETNFKQVAEVTQQGNLIYSSPHRIGYGKGCNFVEYDVPELDEVVIYGYGVNRFADTQRNLGTNATADTLFFNDKPLLNFEEWLLQLDIASKDKTQGGRAHKRIRQIKRILRESDLLPGVKDYAVYVDEQLHTSILFETEYGKLRYNDLGYGYQCMMAWVFDFIKKMFDRYPESENPLQEPAILLVDEIDLHLHPHWQRHVLRDLCRLFPATQIIVSTHSPLVIQSASSMNLFLLNNDGGNTEVVSYPATTFQGWSVEEILHKLMCLAPDTRSEEYATLRSKFEHAMNENNVADGIKYYTKLKAMLYPGSVEADLLEMDMNQLKASGND